MDHIASEHGDLHQLILQQSRRLGSSAAPHPGASAANRPGSSADHRPGSSADHRHSSSAARSPSSSLVPAHPPPPASSRSRTTGK